MNNESSVKNIGISLIIIFEILLIAETTFAHEPLYGQGPKDYRKRILVMSKENLPEG